MQLLNCICGFNNIDSLMIQEKFDPLWTSNSADAQEKRFIRLLNILQFPDFSEALAEGRRFNVDAFLRLRESDDCRLFREWLRNIDDATDDELRERLRSVNAQVANAIHGAGGKALRLIVTTGLGLVPIAGPLLGAGASALDYFVLDRIVPRSGPVAFLDALLPLLRDSP